MGISCLQLTEAVIGVVVGSPANNAAATLNTSCAGSMSYTLKAAHAGFSSVRTPGKTTVF